MTVMRHWVARAPSGDRVARVLDTAEKAEHYREALGFDVSGPFVLESATQGAVAAIAAHRAAIESIGTVTVADDESRARAEAKQAADLALWRFGGR